jgi:hypothetical protein
MGNQPHGANSAEPPVWTADRGIDCRPLRPSNPWDSERRAVELRQVSPDCLVLAPRRGSLVWRALIIFGLSAGPILVMIGTMVETEDPVWEAIGVVGLVLMVLFMVWALRGAQVWIRFDRGTGLMTVGRRRWAGLHPSIAVICSRPLAQIVRVQLLDGGEHTVHMEIGEPGTPGSVYFKQYRSYQLNLVLDDGSEPRVNLVCHADPKWMRQAGERLAAFLAVPVVDHLGNHAG